MRSKAIIRYDGPALSNHEMEINDLAPALLALGDLIRDANRILNGDSANVRVLVSADTEQKCFQLEFDVLLSIGEHILNLMGQDNVKSAKEILEWIGLISGGVMLTGTTVFGALKYIAHLKKQGVTYNIEARDGAVIYIADNGSTINIPEPVHKLLQAPEITKGAKKVIEPVGKEGITNLEFEHDGQVTNTVNQEEANDILNLPQSWVGEKDLETEHISEIQTSVRIKRAVYEGAGMWTIIYQRAVEAKMSDEQFLADFQAGKTKAPPKSILDVDLTVTVPVDKDGIAVSKASYEINKVHKVQLPAEQVGLFDNE